MPSAPSASLYSSSAPPTLRLSTVDHPLLSYPQSEDNLLHRLKAIKEENMSFGFRLKFAYKTAMEASKGFFVRSPPPMKPAPCIVVTPPDEIYADFRPIVKPSRATIIMRSKGDTLKAPPRPTRRGRKSKRMQLYAAVRTRAPAPQVEPPPELRKTPAGARVASREEMLMMGGAEFREALELFFAEQEAAEAEAAGQAKTSDAASGKGAFVNAVAGPSRITLDDSA
ncbi:hypothetical protein BV25DRAFT_1915991 [Artomyces pyxidatus]|uniref:Uncharacterized protein n=1 Tax=Artomyces pyxidatus TaxID=48021 RepID=A0ACB8T2T6_9AGAM|nr:hypothetical protein BV25DRAFT_1915991 [Artomyces pyxidatus]